METLTAFFILGSILGGAFLISNNTAFDGILAYFVRSCKLKFLLRSQSHFIHSDMTQIPEAPSFRISSTHSLVVFMPPIANTGISTSSHTSFKNAVPLGSSPGLQVVANICPAVT